MSRLVVAFLSVCVLAPAAFGQIIYEPVRYQYVTEAGRTYYYGGSQPQTFHWAEHQAYLAARGFNRLGYGLFGERIGDGLLNPEPPVYSDFVPYRDARLFGFTADDARNQALRSAPLYFRKRDLLRAAEVQPDGSVVVPSHPRMVVVIDRKRGANGDADGATTRPTTTTGKILIIPKPKPATSDNAVVASR